MPDTKDGNMFGIKPVVGSKSDTMYNDTVISLLKRLQNQSGLGGFSFGFDGAFDVFSEKTAEEIGQLMDLVSVPYVEGQSIMGFLHTGYYHVHGTGFVYPNHADNVVLTAGAGAWDLTGAITEVIPADTLEVYDFDIHWLNISAISGNGQIQIDIYAGDSGSEVLIGSTRSQRNAVQSQEGAQRIQIPQQVAGKRISCRLSDSTGGALTAAISFEGHYYTII